MNGSTFTAHALDAVAREVEIKFTAPQPDALQRFVDESLSDVFSGAPADAVAGYALTSPAETVDRDIYLDTVGFEFVRAGLALRMRVRRKAGVPVVLFTLKSLATQPLEGMGGGMDSGIGADIDGVLDRLEVEYPAQIDAQDPRLAEFLADRDADDARSGHKSECRARARLCPRIDDAWLPAEIRAHLPGNGRDSLQLHAFLVLEQTRTKRVAHTVPDKGSETVSGTGSDSAPGAKQGTDQAADQGTDHVEISLDAVTVFPGELLIRGRSDRAERKAKARADGKANAKVGVPACGHFYELEVEGLAPEANGVLAAAAKRATKEELVPLTVSKLQRALYLWAGVDQKGVAQGELFTAETELVDALRAILRQTLVDCLLYESGVRADADVEYVHQLRVALRRARTAMRHLGGETPPQALKPVLRGMKKLARRLGAVRDLDVAVLNWRAAAQKDAAATKSTRKRTRASEEKLLAERAAAFKKLLAWLNGPKHAKFVAHLTAFCVGTEPAAHSVSPAGQMRQMRQVRHVLPGLLMEQFLRVRSFEGEPGTLADWPAPTLHALRIECKRLRYMLEFSQHLLGPEVPKVLERLRKLQERLGLVNDAYVEYDRLRGSRHKADRQRRKDLEREIPRLRAKLPKRYRAIVAPTRRRQFIKALMPL